MNSLPFQSAKELVSTIRDKKISSVDLLELYAERYERLNPDAIIFGKSNLPFLLIVEKED